MNLSPSTSPYSHDAPFDHLRAMMIEQQRNESIRAIVVHLLSTAVPALHTNSFVVETKVDFGLPSAHPHGIPEGLWVRASRNGAFFFLSNRYGSEDDHFGMPCVRSLGAVCGRRMRISGVGASWRETGNSTATASFRLPINPMPYALLVKPNPAIGASRRH
jgi:hypothetical protein